MGIFSNLFKKKAKDDIHQNVTAVNQVVNNVQEQGMVGEAVAPLEINDAPASIVVDQSNVLEKMQNNFAVESAKKAEETKVEDNPMNVFNQNVVLDNNNPMAIFGAESKENNEH